METCSKLLKITLPNYLSSLPVPNSFGGLFHLGASELLQLTPLLAILGTSAYFSYKYVNSFAEQDAEEKKRGKVNLNINKECSKIVDTCDIEDLKVQGDKKVYCRCWRSKKFPFCDGSHQAHNDITGDNVGPLIVKK